MQYLSEISHDYNQEHFKTLRLPLSIDMAHFSYMTPINRHESVGSISYQRQSERL